MSLAIKQDDLTVSELKLPSPSDLCLGQISLKNCKDATIGTKIDGNVIVNQYFNDIPADKVLAEGLTFTDSVVLKDWSQKLLQYKYVWLSLILAVVVTTVLCILYIPQTKSLPEDLRPSLNFSLNFRSRDQWSSSKQNLDCDDLKINPAKYVVLSHTVTSVCTNPISCQTTVTMIQSDHISKGLCDIGYNFLIGDDGYIYEGLGWGKYGAHTYGFNCDSIGIAFIGNFNLDYPTDKMIQLYALIINEGLRLNQLAPDYKLIAQKQVISFASPGIHIEELMSKWDHWSLVTASDYLCE